VKCDVDSSPAILPNTVSETYPTILFFKDGKIADKQVGAVPKKNLLQN